MSEKKHRDECVHAIVDCRTGEITISYDPVSKEVRIEGAEHCATERSYARGTGKPKVLSRIPSHTGGMFFDTIDAIQNNYDFLVAVDTNTRVFGGHKSSVTGVTVAQKAWAVGSRTAASRCWQYFTPLCIDFTDLAAPPEKVGWIVALQSLEQHGIINREMRLGIVVDSYLSEHEQSTKDPARRLQLSAAQMDAHLCDVQPWKRGFCEPADRTCRSRFSIGVVRTANGIAWTRERLTCAIGCL